MRRPLGLVLAVGLGAVVACGTDPPVGPTDSPSPGAETDALVAALRARGARIDLVEVMGPVSFPFLSVNARRFSMEGENVYVFEYPSSTEAAAAAAGISPSGYEIAKPGGPTSHVDWIAAPHFYRSGRLLVLYVGQTAALIGHLQAVLGPQIAGG